MTITTTAKNLRRGDRIQNWGPAERELTVETVHELIDENGIYPVVELSDASEWELRSWGATLEVIR